MGRNSPLVSCILYPVSCILVYCILYPETPTLVPGVNNPKTPSRWVGPLLSLLRPCLELKILKLPVGELDLFSRFFDLAWSKTVLKLLVGELDLFSRCFDLAWSKTVLKLLVQWVESLFLLLRNCLEEKLPKIL